MGKTRELGALYMVALFILVVSVICLLLAGVFFTEQSKLNCKRRQQLKRSNTLEVQLKC